MDNTDKKPEIKKDNFFNQFAWWKFSQEEEKEMNNQVINHDTLGITKSIRGKAALATLFFVGLSIVLVLINFVSTSLLAVYEGSSYLFLIFFIFKGKRWAIIATMILWTIDKIYGLYLSAANNVGVPAYLIALIVWSYLMKLLYFSYKVEMLRSKQ